MKLKPEHLVLYAVTDRGSLGTFTLREQVECALKGGATMVQLREKSLSEEDFEAEAREILSLCRSYAVPLLINDNVPLAKRIGADGVHVGQEDMDPQQARQLLGEDAIIGVTAKTIEQAKKAERAGADYLGSGAVFGSTTKTNAIPMSQDLLRQITKSVSIPVVAIGGIHRANMGRLMGLGMKGFAVVSGIFGAEDIETETRLLKEKAQEVLHDEVLLSSIAKKRPLVQCITNLVTAGDCANALLAIGASPTMAHHPDEMEDFAKVIDALVWNLGATESLPAIRASAAYQKEGLPIVLDPVGCSTSSFRRKEALRLMKVAKPLCIRGNGAEIRSLAKDITLGGGVDAGGTSLEDSLLSARLLSKESGSLVVATGEVDVLSYGEETLLVDGGTPLFKRLTGAGCMLSAMMGAFLSVEPSLFGAGACCRYLARCGERAEETIRREHKGMGSFRAALFDELSLFLL